MGALASSPRVPLPPFQQYQAWRLSDVMTMQERFERDAAVLQARTGNNGGNSANDSSARGGRKASSRNAVVPPSPTPCFGFRIDLAAFQALLKDLPIPPKRRTDEEEEEEAAAAAEQDNARHPQQQMHHATPPPHPRALQQHPHHHHQSSTTPAAFAFAPALSVQLNGVSMRPLAASTVSSPRAGLGVSEEKVNNHAPRPPPHAAPRRAFFSPHPPSGASTPRHRELPHKHKLVALDPAALYAAWVGSDPCAPEQLDVRELLSALMVLCRGRFDAKMMALFALFDVDDDGRLSRTEMQNMVRCVAVALHRVYGLSATAPNAPQQQQQQQLMQNQPSRPGTSARNVSFASSPSSSSSSSSSPFPSLRPSTAPGTGATTIMDGDVMLRDPSARQCERWNETLVRRFESSLRSGAWDREGLLEWARSSPVAVHLLCSGCRRATDGGMNTTDAPAVLARLADAHRAHAGPQALQQQPPPHGQPHARPQTVSLMMGASQHVDFSASSSGNKDSGGAHAAMARSLATARALRSRSLTARSASATAGSSALDGLGFGFDYAGNNRASASTGGGVSSSSFASSLSASGVRRYSSPERRRGGKLGSSATPFASSPHVTHRLALRAHDDAALLVDLMGQAMQMGAAASAATATGRRAGLHLASPRSARGASSSAAAPSVSLTVTSPSMSSRSSIGLHHHQRQRPSASFSPLPRGTTSSMVSLGQFSEADSSMSQQQQHQQQQHSLPRRFTFLGKSTAREVAALKALFDQADTDSQGTVPLEVFLPWTAATTHARTSSSDANASLDAGAVPTSSSHSSNGKSVPRVVPRKATESFLWRDVTTAVQEWRQAQLDMAQARAAANAAAAAAAAAVSNADVDPDVPFLAPLPVSPSSVLPAEVSFSELLDILYGGVGVLSSASHALLHSWVPAPVTRDTVRLIARVFDRLDTEFSGRVKFGKIMAAFRGEGMMTSSAASGGTGGSAVTTSGANIPPTPSMAASSGQQQQAGMMSTSTLSFANGGAPSPAAGGQNINHSSASTNSALISPSVASLLSSPHDQALLSKLMLPFSRLRPHRFDVHVSLRELLTALFHRSHPKQLRKILSFVRPTAKQLSPDQLAELAALFARAHDRHNEGRFPAERLRTHLLRQGVPDKEVDAMMKDIVLEYAPAAAPPPLSSSFPPMTPRVAPVASPTSAPTPAMSPLPSSKASSRTLHVVTDAAQTGGASAPSSPAAAALNSPAATGTGTAVPLVGLINLQEFQLFYRDLWDSHVNYNIDLLRSSNFADMGATGMATDGTSEAVDAWTALMSSSSSSSSSSSATAVAAAKKRARLADTPSVQGWTPEKDEMDAAAAAAAVDYRPITD